MNRFSRRVSSIALPAALLVVATGADPAPTFNWTVDSIMRGPALVGYPPTGLRWSGDSARLYFEWKKHREDEASTYLVSRDAASPRRLSDQERKQAPPVAGEWDQARRRALWIDEGDVVLLDTVTGQRRELTRTSAAESDAHFARGETAVTFVRDNGLFLLPLSGSGDLLAQLAEAGPKQDDPKLSDSQKRIAGEEKKLLHWTKEAARLREKREAEEKKRALPRLELGPRQSIADAVLMAGDRYALVLVAEKGEGKQAQVPRYVSESGYTEEIPSRTKVGDSPGRTRLAVLDLVEKKTTLLKSDFAGPARALPGTPEAVAPARQDAATSTDQPASTASEKAGEKAGGASVEKREQAPREVDWSRPLLSPDGRRAVADVRSLDFEDRFLVLIDPEKAEARLVEQDHDDAWLRFYFAGDELGWQGDSKRIWFASERTGFMHLYTLDVSQPGARTVALTSGAFEVTDATLTADGKSFLVQSTEESAYERHVYSVPVDGGARTRLTLGRGSWEAVASPDGRQLGLIHSTGNRPPEVFLSAAKPGATPKALTSSASAEWLAGPWLDPELVTFEARDGAKVPARLYTPERLGVARDPKQPGVVFVHGAGYLQNAHHYWSSYFREYLFHHLLAASGYVVLDLDYRGSAGLGRDWRTAIYRHMGGQDLDDVVDAARFLSEKQGVAPKRIGVYGGSYGGFITLMALFTTPDVFKAGAALRPVTDWAHYSHSYTANILNEPAQDSEAFNRSSPIYFAEGLKSALLICHGMVDVNVHFQDSVRLAQRLIELRKENWELAAYPVEDHGFVEETSWADEYKRILKLFETHLKN